MSFSPEHPPDFGSEPAGAETGASPLTVAIRHKWLISLGLIAGLAGGYLYYLRQDPIFQSFARVMIVQHNASLPIEGVQQVQKGMVDAHIVRIQSPSIVKLAVESRDLAKLQTLRDEADPVDALIEGLSVRRTENSDVLDIVFEGPYPADCKVIVDAVLYSYLDFVKKSQKDTAQEALELIEKAKSDVNVDLEQARAKYMEWLQKDAPSELLRSGNEVRSIHQGRLAGIEKTRQGVQLERAQAMAELKSIEQAIARGDSRESLLLRMEKSSSLKSADGTSLAPLTGQLLPLLIEEQRLLGKVGPDHPDVRDIRLQITMTREQLGGGSKSEDGENQETRDFVDIYCDSLRGQIESLSAQDAALEEEYERELRAAADLAVSERMEEDLVDDIERQKRFFNAIVDRLEGVQLVTDHTGYEAETIWPSTDAEQIGPNIAAALGVGGMLGLAVTGLIAFLLEALDRSFRSPEEISRTVDYPVVGHIPVIEPRVSRGNEDLDWSLCSVHAPKSRTTESFRAIRTGLYFNNRGTAHKILQVTSPNPSEGKSTLSSNLAVTIARSGKRVLLIDADMRRPRIHSLFGLENRSGVSSIVGRHVEYNDAIQQSGIENLEIITSGKRPENPSELLTSPEFQQMLDWSREEYDYVVVDTPPVLAVTDPGVVAARVDGVLVAMRLTKRARQNLTQTIDLLNTVGANVVGIVVNGLGDRSNYSAFGRSYVYMSPYSYGYGYGNNLYYIDDVPEGAAAVNSRDMNA